MGAASMRLRIVRQARYPIKKEKQSQVDAILFAQKNETDATERLARVDFSFFLRSFRVDHLPRLAFPEAVVSRRAGIHIGKLKGKIKHLQ